MGCLHIECIYKTHYHFHLFLVHLLIQTASIHQEHSTICVSCDKVMLVGDARLATQARQIGILRMALDCGIRIAKTQKRTDLYRVIQSHFTRRVNPSATPWKYSLEMYTNITWQLQSYKCLMSNLLTINEGKVNRGQGLRWLQHCTCQKSLNAIEKRAYNVGS